MSWAIHSASGVNLQATLAAGSADLANQVCKPHHPITCTGAEMAYDLDEGVLECGHTATESGDGRVKSCVQHSIAILIFEELHKRVSR